MLGSDGWLDFLPFSVFLLCLAPLLVESNGWSTPTWPEKFFAALSLVLVSLSQYVPCDACSDRLVMFQRFQGC